MEPELEFWMADEFCENEYELDADEADDLMALGVAFPCRNCSSRASIVLHCDWQATA
jgi:hypothetical protein